MVTPCQLRGTHWAGLQQWGEAEPSKLTWGEKWNGVSDSHSNRIASTLLRLVMVKVTE